MYAFGRLKKSHMNMDPWSSDAFHAFTAFAYLLWGIPLLPFHLPIV